VNNKSCHQLNIVKEVVVGKLGSGLAQERDAVRVQSGIALMTDMTW
jgi:hypothetical protein